VLDTVFLARRLTLNSYRCSHLPFQATLPSRRARQTTGTLYNTSGQRGPHTRYARREDTRRAVLVIATSRWRMTTPFTVVFGHCRTFLTGQLLAGVGIGTAAALRGSRPATARLPLALRTWRAALPPWILAVGLYLLFYLPPFYIQPTC